MSNLNRRKLCDFVISGAYFSMIIASGAEWWVLFPTVLLILWNFYDGATRHTLKD